MIFITGCAGMLAKDIIAVLEKNNLEHSGCDIKYNPYYVCDVNSRKFQKTIDTIKPKIIINCGAMINVEKCENDFEKALSANTKSVINIIEACKRNNTKLIHISTSAVYDSVESKRHSEDDELNAVNIYAKTKEYAENLIKNYYENNSIIIRTNIISKNHSFFNFVKNIKEKTEIYEDIICNYIDTISIAEIIIELIYSNNIGIYNIACKNEISKYDLAVKIRKLNNQHTELLIKSSYNQSIKRPKNSVMNTNKIESFLADRGKSLIDFEKSFYRCFEKGEL